MGGNSDGSRSKASRVLRLLKVLFASYAAAIGIGIACIVIGTLFLDLAK